MHQFPIGNLHIIRIQGYLIAHCNDENDGYAEINLKEDKIGWHKAEPVERVYAKYDPNNNLPNNLSALPNQIEKEVKSLVRAVCVTN